jgi:hypothetical protein
VYNRVTLLTQYCCNVGTLLCLGYTVAILSHIGMILVWCKIVTVLQKCRNPPCVVYYYMSFAFIFGGSKKLSNTTVDTIVTLLYT